MGRAGAALMALVGANIQAARKAKGMTQGQLAEALGVEIETITRYEGGVIAPAFGKLERLCEILDVPAWKLFSDGVAVPDAANSTIADSLKLLSLADREFVLKFVESYAEHHKQ